LYREYKELFPEPQAKSDYDKALETAEKAFYYARDVLHAPFPEGEATIATSAFCSFLYARDFLKAPFPLGEAAISRNSCYSFAYAFNVLKAPWPEGEDAIAKDAGYSYLYAKEVLKKPFPLGEKAISTNGYYIEIYKELFPETQVAPAPQSPAPATSMSDKQKRKQKQKDVIKSTFLTLIFTLQDIIGYDQESRTYFWVGSLFEADSILKSIHDLMETFPNLTKNLVTKKYSKTYLKVKSYMDEYFKKMKEENEKGKQEKEKQEKEKPNV
jgi:lambda repressor-like predicted transcriptional regulator